MARQAIPTHQNLLLWSQTFANGVWTLDSAGTGINPVVTDNFAIAPDGTMTAARIQFDKGAGVGFSRIQQSSPIQFDPNQLYQWSVFIKTNDGTTKTVGLRIGGTGAAFSVNGAWPTLCPSGAFAQPLPIGSPSASLTAQLMLWNSLGTSNTADLLVWCGQIVKANWAGPATATAGAVVNTGNIRNLP